MLGSVSTTTVSRAESTDWEHPLGDVIRRAATDWPDREALVIDGDRVSYRELFKLASTVAARLVGLGVQAETHVAIMGRNSIEWVVAYFATAILGAVSVPINPRFAPREIRFILKKARCHLLLAEAGASSMLGLDLAPDEQVPALPFGIFEFTRGRDRFATLPDGIAVDKMADVSPDATAVIMFTSGSTAFPKGCVLSHRGLVRNAVLHDRRLHLSEQDRWYGPTPFFHASGCVWGILSTATVGATLISGARFDAEQAMELLEREKCTYQHGIDTMFVRQLEVNKRRTFDLQHLTKGTTTGPFSLIRRIREELGIEFIMSKWGATEGHGNLALCDIDDPLERRLETHGRIYKEFEYRIADPETGDLSVAHGEVGEIQVRGAAMNGYYDEPEATACTILADGWLRTGDLGRLEDDFLIFTGRLKDMIKIAGENVAAQEIEAALIAHPDVLNVAVIGKSHPEWGEIAVAFIETLSGRRPSHTQLADHCRTRLSAIKVPRRIVCLHELPRTGSGKIDKNSLRKIGVE